MNHLTVFVLIILASSLTAQARNVRLLVTDQIRTNQIQIAANETVRLLGRADTSDNPSTKAVIKVTAGETPFLFCQSCLLGADFPTLVGPATIEMFYYNTLGYTRAAYLSLEITPDPYPPNQTVIVPADGKGANVQLECSTNLVEWNSATNGIYSSTNTPKFFRIRAERIP